jgi:hypothetical protein
MLFPELVKTNARFRGPMESQKQDALVRDTAATIDLLYSLFTKQQNAVASFSTRIHEWEQTMQIQTDELRDKIGIEKGGEW